MGDVAVVALGAGFAEFLAFAHEDHRRSPVDPAYGLGAATSLPGSSYLPGRAVAIGQSHVSGLYHIARWTALPQRSLQILSL